MNKNNTLFCLFCGLLVFKVFSNDSIRPSIHEGENALEKLYSYNILREGDPVRLHLGCGQNHFDGYVNIDYSPAEHTVQAKIGADVFADIAYLNFPENSVDEIRSHHVFEHFDRGAALGLLCKWHRWLKVGGKLIIETPDFDGCVRFYMNPRNSYTKKQAVIRHLFGSHEARWAVHCDGWYKEKFERVLNTLGFRDISSRLYHYATVLYNITVTAYKKESINDMRLRQLAGNILNDSQIGKGGKKIMEVWLGIFDQVFIKQKFV